MKLYELTAWYTKVKDTKGEYGMEIETETKSPRDYPVDFLYNSNVKGEFKVKGAPDWFGKGDGSLRNYGIEYVLKKPLDFAKALVAIDKWAESSKDIPFIPNSPSTSVHVHINMMQETPLTLANFCTLYVLYENILLEFAGESRRSNLFSLPTRCAEPTYTNIIQMFRHLSQGKVQGVMFHFEAVKYASLNLAPLSKLGSVEIRCMRGETDPEVLKTWLGIINRLLVVARTEGMTPRDIILNYKNEGLYDFYNVFGEFAEELEAICNKAGMDVVNLIDHNLWYAGCIASSIDDWNSISDAILEAKKSYEDRNNMINKMANNEMANKVLDPKIAMVAAADFIDELQPPPEFWGDHDDDDEEDYEEDE